MDDIITDETSPEELCGIARKMIASGRRDEALILLSDWSRGPEIFYMVEGRLHVMCSDTFAYSSADSEPVPDEDLDLLLSEIEKDGTCSIPAYVSAKRGGIETLWGSAGTYFVGKVAVAEEYQKRADAPREGMLARLSKLAKRLWSRDE